MLNTAIRKALIIKERYKQTLLVAETFPFLQNDAVLPSLGQHKVLLKHVVSRYLKLLNCRIG